MAALLGAFILWLLATSEGENKVLAWIGILWDIEGAGYKGPA